MLSKMPLDAGAMIIVERLHSAGYEVNVVGGAVRNHILGIPVSDIDMTTSATPDVTASLFSDFRVIETGIKHGTVTILIEKEPFEVTTYRTDGSYLDNRHPESVCFTPNLSEDLARRDFTINAIAYNPYDGFTDLFDGISDIGNRIIRAVGDPETRFREDALRILRAIRFASVLGFTVEPKTALAVRQTAQLLNNVSRERIFSEWIKLIGGMSAYEIISNYRDVVSVAIPQLVDIRLPEKKLFDFADKTARMLSLFYLSTADPVSSFDLAMTALRTDNKTRKMGTDALKIIKDYNLNSLVGVLLAVYRFDTESVSTAIDLAYTVKKIDSDEYAAGKTALSNAKIKSISDLAVGGRDMIALGFRGQDIGLTLDRIAVAVIEGKCQNDRESIFQYLKK